MTRSPAKPKQAKPPFRWILEVDPSVYSAKLAARLRRMGYEPIRATPGTVRVLDVEAMHSGSVLLNCAVRAIRDADSTEGAKTRFGRYLALALSEEAITELPRKKR